MISINWLYYKLKGGHWCFSMRKRWTLNIFFFFKYSTAMYLPNSKFRRWLSKLCSHCLKRNDNTSLNLGMLLFLEKEGGKKRKREGGCFLGLELWFVYALIRVWEVLDKKHIHDLKAYIFYSQSTQVNHLENTTSGFLFMCSFLQIYCFQTVREQT